MDGLSSSNGLHSKETGSNIPPLLTKKLMPRRLTPIGLEGPNPATQPPPPPPTPAPWSWYHRNCNQSPNPRSKSPQLIPPPSTPAARSSNHRQHSKILKPLSRYNRQQNNTKKTTTSLRGTDNPPLDGAKATRAHQRYGSTDELWSLYKFLNGRTHLLVEYVLHFLSRSERGALVQILQRSEASANLYPRHERQFKKCNNENPTECDENGLPMECYLAAPSSSGTSFWSESGQSQSEQHEPLTTTTDLDSDYSSYGNSSTEPLIPLPRRLPVPDVQEVAVLPPPMLYPGSARSSPGRRLPVLPATRSTPHIYVNIDPFNYGFGGSVPVHRRFPAPAAYRPHKPVVATNDQIHLGRVGDVVDRNVEDMRIWRRLLLQFKSCALLGVAIAVSFLAFLFHFLIKSMGPVSYPQGGSQVPPCHNSFESKIGRLWCKNSRTQEELLLLRKLPELVSDRMYQSLLQETQMSEFLLQVAQAIFEELVSLDQLIKKILEVAQRLVSADRASLFLVDHRNFELVSTVFDLRYESKNDTDFSKKEIRMPINKGIAGHVAMSGETMNIPDAYSDERFNKAVDEATGYRTVSILCMPIKVRGKVIAVVQMVNKRDKVAFGNDDEAAFQIFSTFFGLALHHAKLYDKIKRKEQKYKVALEVLGYHNTCAEEDVVNLLDERKKLENLNYNDFALNPFEVDDVEKCKGILTMFDDLFDLTKFDEIALARFILTVKKNYRKVPYHNFDHGWAVANAMYVMLKHDTENRYDYNNRLALFVACLCHDLDHRGYTNKFMSEIASPLATIYTTSTLEHHHFNMTVTILQQDGHNIFNHLSSAGYKDMLDSIRQCILATDLATFFPDLKEINELLLESTQFNWNDVNHSALVRSFSMRCADLCAAAKPFEVQLVTAEIITAEFYLQGDLERLAGRTPIPMMDRSRPEELPACQVGFLSQICLPCYSVLQKLFPTTEPMLNMTKENLEIWKARASAIEEKNKSQ